MREYVVTCCSTADMSRTFMETNEVPFAMFHYQLDGKEYADDLYSSIKVRSMSEALYRIRRRRAACDLSGECRGILRVV